jgi:mannose-1-phosphate guanylyltransferase
MNTDGFDFRPVVLAGGSGTRFWPRSRKTLAKQVLALDGERTMIQCTVDRLAPLADEQHVWVITNDGLSEAIAGQLKGLSPNHILCEPAARNTAPAAGLAAFILEKTAPDSVLGIFPADHVIANQSVFLQVLKEAIHIAADGDNIVVIGIQPTRPETGYGYIETGSTCTSFSTEDVMRVRRFTEKPDRARAAQFIASGNFYWNSGIFLWRARTLASALREHLPRTAALLESIAQTYDTPDFAQAFATLYPQCENISIDYAVLEPRSAKGEEASHMYCLPAEFGWNDLGSWAALYEHKAGIDQDNGTAANVTDAADALSIEASGNYVYSPGKFVALVGVDDLVVVDTGDALLITTRARSQDVGKIVKELQAQDKTALL